MTSNDNSKKQVILVSTGVFQSYITTNIDQLLKFDFNIHVIIDNNFGLAFRRLAIIDLSENANQPISSNDKNFVCVFNGQIYNYREIRAELETKNIRF